MTFQVEQIKHGIGAVVRANKSGFGDARFADHVNAMTDAMRQELGDRNIRVSILMPGATTTEVGDHISDPVWRKAIQDHVSREGAVLPAEIGETIVFMLSLPRRVNISEISVRPTGDTSA